MFVGDRQVLARWFDERAVLGEAVAGVIGSVKILAIRDIPRSGEPDELLDKYGINRKAIVQAVRERLGK